MLIVVRPGTTGFQPAALFGVASSCCWALALIITRKIAASDAPQTTILWSSVIGVILLTILLPFDVQWPTWWQLALCLMLGVLSSAGQWLVVLAHRLAPASVLAPFSYTQLPWVTIGGYLVFANLPDRWTLVGASIIIASGLCTRAPGPRQGTTGARGGQRTPLTAEYAVTYHAGKNNGFIERTLKSCLPF